MTLYAKIIGTGSALPERQVSNQDLVDYLASRGVETNDEWITSRTGITTRYFAAPETMTSDLACTAAQQAIQTAQIDRQNIDLILVATSTHDHLGGFPSTACIVQTKLGIHNNCAAFDIQAVCSGFVYALSVANQFIRSGTYKNILVIGAEIFSRILNFDDRRTCVLFGDGAGAVLLTASTTPGILSTAMHADGRYANILSVPGYAHSGTIAGSAFLQMDGQAVFKLAVNVLDKVAQEVLSTSQISAEQIDWFVPHQANIRIMQSTAKKLGIPLDKVVVTVDQHGNTSAASIPLALNLAINDGRIRPNDYVLLEGVGGGFTWAAALLQI